MEKMEHLAVKVFMDIHHLLSKPFSDDECLTRDAPLSSLLGNDVYIMVKYRQWT